MGLDDMRRAGALESVRIGRADLTAMMEHATRAHGAVRAASPGRRQFLAACEACLRAADLALADAGYEVAEKIERHESAITRTTTFTLGLDPPERRQLERLMHLAETIAGDDMAMVPPRDVQLAIDLAERLRMALPERLRPEVAPIRRRRR